MKALVTGSAGMLANDLIPCLRNQGYEVIAPPENRLDITSIDSITAAVRDSRPGIIFNCAAYTRVDDAEKEEQLANTINGLGVQNLCILCQQHDLPLVHFSTDYVFDGTKAGAYNIHDKPNPINAYGRSKLFGEKYVRSLLSKFYLIRTSWLFGLHGRNFVETMLELGKKQKQVSIVTDQRGCPTWTRHLAEATVSLVESGRYGVYHITNSEPTTWFEFAKEIFRLAGMTIEVLPVNSEQFLRPAPRPSNSVLDASKLKEVLGREMPSWKAALEEYLAERKEKAKI